MKITVLRKHGGGIAYQLRNDDDSFIANFDALYDAATVARYIAGADMSDGERAQAVAAMKNTQGDDGA